MISKAIIMGRLGADPEVRYTADGTAVANLRIATNVKYKDKEGNTKERTTWHRVICWRRLAEVASNYLKKGRLVYIEGEIQNREYERQDGQKQVVYEIIASTMHMLPIGNIGHQNRANGKEKEDDVFVPEDEEIF